jgi:ribosome biogenesis protein Nip4
MTREERLTELEQQWAGRKVVMVGDHPHADCIGVIDHVDRKLAAFKVNAVNCAHLDSGWYVFNGNELRPLTT